MEEGIKKKSRKGAEIWALKSFRDRSISVLEEKILSHECGSVHKEDSDKIELNDNIVNDSDDSFHTGSDMDENPFTVDTETFENEQAGLVPAQDVKEDTDDGIDDYILSLLGGYL